MLYQSSMYLSVLIQCLCINVYLLYGQLAVYTWPCARVPVSTSILIIPEISIEL